MKNQYEVDLPDFLNAISLANLASAMVTKGKDSMLLAGNNTLQGYWGNTSIELLDRDGYTICKVIPA